MIKRRSNIYRITTIGFLILSTLLFSCKGSYDTAGSPSDSRTKAIDALARLPILDGGRVKPLDTYARSMLLRFSGKQQNSGHSAIDWLATVIFSPERAYHDKIFLINNPEIAQALGVSPEKKRRYSYAQLAPGFGKMDTLYRAAKNNDKDTRTIFEKELLRTVSNIRTFDLLMCTFNFALPHPDFDIHDPEAARILGIHHQDGHFSYLDMLSYASGLSNAVKSIQAKKTEPLSTADMALVRLARILYAWGLQTDHIPFPVIPSQNIANEKNPWLTPWEVVKAPGFSKRQNSSIALLISIQQAFRSEKYENMYKLIERYKKLHNAALTPYMNRLTMEHIYNKVNPFLYSKIIYGIALLLAIFVLAFPKPIVYRITFVFFIFGIVPHCFGIIDHMYIMNHPPVTNLYETFVFVALVCVLLGLVMEMLQKQALGFLIAGLGGFVFLHIASRYSLEGDTMGVLVAVLNSNFWLATHVITIAAGYAGCVGAGIVGHVYCLFYLFSHNKQRRTGISRALYGILAFGLTFTATGTVLGGMWADQAWGRFWGWDPKENGALLIVLWCTIIFHARIGGIIREFGMAIGSIIGLILVMFAWVGVNLLGVGLHSYGFTSKGATLFFAFIAGEIVFLLFIGGSALLKRYTNWGRNGVEPRLTN